MVHCAYDIAITDFGSAQGENSLFVTLFNSFLFSPGMKNNLEARIYDLELSQSKVFQQNDVTTHPQWAPIFSRNPHLLSAYSQSGNQAFYISV
jgi:hypothetical protein